MKLAPLGERIIIEEITHDKIGSIYVPTQKGSLVGKVIAVGEDARWANVGDTVLFGRHAGFKLPVSEDLKEYRGCILMNDEDLLAKMEDIENAG